MDNELTKSPATYFAPAGRDTPQDFAQKQQAVERSPLLYEALNAVSEMVLILNDHRQILAANQSALEMLKAAASDLLAKRPGEAVGCVWSKEGPDGCGTDQHCVTCGAVNAILESQQKNVHVVKECRIRVTGPTGSSSLDLKVAATPITVEGQRFIVVAIEDISQPKRLEVLQRVFFHDILNTVGCISGYAAYLTEVVHRAKRIDQRDVRHPPAKLAVVLLADRLDGFSAFFGRDDHDCRCVGQSSQRVCPLIPTT